VSEEREADVNLERKKKKILKNTRKITPTNGIIVGKERLSEKESRHLLAGL
jgi:hypothetical protein